MANKEHAVFVYLARTHRMCWNILHRMLTINESLGCTNYACHCIQWLELIGMDTSDGQKRSKRLALTAIISWIGIDPYVSVLLELPFPPSCVPRKTMNEIASAMTLRWCSLSLGVQFFFSTFDASIATTDRHFFRSYWKNGPQKIRKGKKSHWFHKNHPQLSILPSNRLLLCEQFISLPGYIVSLCMDRGSPIQVTRCITQKGKNCPKSHPPIVLLSIQS